MSVKTISNILDKLASNKPNEENRWSAAGLALASISDGFRDMGRMAYSFFESHNYHAICSLLNWSMNLYEFKHNDDVNNIRWLFDNHSYQVCVKRNEDGSWEKKKIRLRIVVEEVE